MGAIVATITTETTEGIQVGLPILVTLGTVDLGANLPDPTGNGGAVLGTNGTAASWTRSFTSPDGETVISTYDGGGGLDWDGAGGAYAYADVDSVEGAFITAGDGVSESATVKAKSDGTVEINATGAATLNSHALVVDTDARLTDARTPTAHKSSHATGGSDALSPSDIGAARAGIVTSGRARVAFLGDSIAIGASTYGAGGAGGQEDSNAPPLAAMLASRGQWMLSINAGVSAQTSTQIRARISSDVVAVGADVCVILSCCWNDISASTSVTDSMTQITGIVDDLLAAGILPVLCSPTPDSATTYTSGRNTAVLARERQMSALARVRNIPYVNLWKVLADPTTGKMASSYDAGDVHPNASGRVAAGQAIATVLDRVLTRDGHAGAISRLDPDDLMGGAGWFAVDSNADGLADGWFAGGVSVTKSRISDTALGYVQRLATSATSDNAIMYATSTWSATANHVYEVSGYISKVGTSQAQLQVYLDSAGGHRKVTVLGTAPDVTRLPFCVRWAPTAGGTVTPLLLAGAGTGYVEFAQVAIRDLTAAGLA